MKKLEKKQIPAVLVCGAVTCGAAWYGCNQLANQPVPKPTPPRNVQALQNAPGPAAEPGAVAASGPAMAAATPRARGELTRFAVVPPSYTNDPFNPVYQEADPLASRTKLATKSMKQFGEALGKAWSGFGKMLGGGERVNMNAPQLPPTGEWTPAVLSSHPRTAELAPDEVMGGGSEGPGGLRSAPQPEPILRPTLTLTGVIQGDPSVAILRGASDHERQVVRVNDRVAGRYIVQSITPEGILLTASGPRPDRWFLPLGEGEKQ